MPQYKLVYFNSKGGAEGIRLLFALAGEAYEDYRFKEGEWPGEWKAATPFGEVPILQIDGKTELCQSKAIGRFLAKRFGLAGKTEMEQAKVDMIADCTDDILFPLIPLFREQDEARKAEIRKKYSEETFPQLMAKFENLLAANGTGVFVGSELTWADLFFFHKSSLPPLAGIECSLDKYPNILKLKNIVESNPKIAAWIKSRPETKF